METTIDMSVDPQFVALRAQEREQELRVMSERFAAHAHAHDLVDRVYGALHYVDDTPWYERSPAWVLDKMREVGAVRTHEKVTETKTRACLRRLVRDGLLRGVDRGDVFYKWQL